MINAYQQALAAARDTEPATRGRVRCWKVLRNPTSVALVVLSYVAGDIDAEVIWSGMGPAPELEFLVDGLNERIGVGAVLVSALYDKYIASVGASFLVSVLPQLNASVVH